MARLEDLNSIEEVVELINDGGSSMRGSNQIAADYAFQGAEENGYGTGKEEIEAQLDALIEAGAYFDYTAALELAIKTNER